YRLSCSVSSDSISRVLSFYGSVAHRALHSFPTRRSSDLFGYSRLYGGVPGGQAELVRVPKANVGPLVVPDALSDEQVLFLSDIRSEEHTSELQSRENLVCRLLLEKKKIKKHERTRV